MTFLFRFWRKYCGPTRHEHIWPCALFTIQPVNFGQDLSSLVRRPFNRLGTCDRASCAMHVAMTMPFPPFVSDFCFVHGTQFSCLHHIDTKHSLSPQLHWRLPPDGVPGPETSFKFRYNVIPFASQECVHMSPVICQS